MLSKITAGLMAGVLIGLTAAVSADPAADIVSKPCAGCHGVDGASHGAAPVIAGQSQMYLAQTMRAYRDGARYATIMDRIAKGYSDAQLDAMAGYFAARSWHQPTQTTDTALAAKGKELHNAKGCAGCHGANGISMMPNAPRLAGQYAPFLKQQMMDYQDAAKSIPPTAMAMRGMLAGLSDDDLTALAEFYASEK